MFVGSCSSHLWRGLRFWEQKQRVWPGLPQKGGIPLLSHPTGLFSHPTSGGRMLVDATSLRGRVEKRRKNAEMFEHSWTWTKSYNCCCRFRSNMIIWNNQFSLQTMLQISTRLTLQNVAVKLRSIEFSILEKKKPDSSNLLNCRQLNIKVCEKI